MTQAALRLIAALETTAIYIVVLDLSKAYESVVKQILLQNISQIIDQNLTNQLLIFLLILKSKVAVDIKDTHISMDKGLTQSGTSSPALFRTFIHDLPKAVREALQTEGKLRNNLDPLRLAADDAVGLVHDTHSLQLTLDASNE